MKKSPKNIAASVRQRLLNLSRQRTEDFNFVLTKYALERFLYRLSCSEFRDIFLLKGAMLFSIWQDKPHRPTRDIDVLGFITNDIPHLENIFKILCNVVVEDDGLFFFADTVKGVEIREAKKYQGVRITMTAKLNKATVPIQVDIGFGDAVTPEPEYIEYPTLLDFSAPRLHVYPKYTVVAEKFEAMTSLGIANSRMKDFYDIWILMQTLDFQGSILSQAIKATFERRMTKLPHVAPLALTKEFAEDSSKQKQWQGFIKKNKLPIDNSLINIISQLKKFLMPPTLAAIEECAFLQVWQPSVEIWQPIKR
ncbi:nucleotidyl transferase AbiEii/AbiGii toxin family protein [Candidatus Parabeggiatoa sp. HSG14]|uniref:nucleotidyl transferase AbiEii/AbiGii toxin family protein n=1 Tax=Candidatus Parabeggiatoa sp. HSG14 TaxID=3055593 RepID=UPI0025A7BCB8|nr:nucleotidyl transferase AbiEii/AbiGii toxin family protein [Thiotrichales bacterium HSG14]